ATLLPGIEPRPRDREQPTQHPYRVVGLLPVDEREPHAFSFAKKAAAFRRICLCRCLSRQSGPGQGLALHGAAQDVEEQVAFEPAAIRSIDELLEVAREVLAADTVKGASEPAL